MMTHNQPITHSRRGFHPDLTWFPPKQLVLDREDELLHQARTQSPDQAERSAKGFSKDVRPL